MSDGQRTLASPCARSGVRALSAHDATSHPQAGVITGWAVYSSANRDLCDRLRRETQLLVEDALWIATDAARALQYAHDHGTKGDPGG
jgi:hypothetical protein